MKKIPRFAMRCILFGNLICSIAFAQEAQWDEIGAGHMRFTAVKVAPDNSDIIYAAAKDCIIKSENGGKTWQQCAAIATGRLIVSAVWLDASDKHKIYAATDNGLYVSSDSGKSWQKIFQSKGIRENECTDIVVTAGGAYLGTKNGLFMSRLSSFDWQRVDGILGHSHIFSLAKGSGGKPCIYAASSRGVFKTNANGKSWKSIFQYHVSEDEDGASTGEPEEETDDDARSPGFISVLHGHSHERLYLAGRFGLLTSMDGAKTWQPFTSIGLFASGVPRLYCDKQSNLFAVFRNRIFIYQHDGWSEVLCSSITGDIRAIAFGSGSTIYVAHDGGLLKSVKYGVICANVPGSPGIPPRQSDEPGIEELVRAAIAYAEVEPGKISAWRKKAATKAWLPQLTVGLRRDVSDLWHWESGSTTKSGDDVLIEGDDSVAWDISCSWDLSELIWNDDQTSIDVRSRLMVQLRDDITSQLTRIYFERLKVKHELDTLALIDTRKRFEKELRLQELTVSLDTLTGGYFLRKIKTHQEKQD